MSAASSNIIKFITAFFVVVIHTTAFEENLFIKTQHFFSLEFIGVVLNQAARFSVPIFLFLSGYGLAKNFKKNKLTTRDFYLKRGTRVLLTYIFITIIFTIFINHKIHLGLFFNSNTFLSQLKKLGFIFLTGRADYHTYFLSIIIQLYILFPILYKFRMPVIWFLFLVLNILYTYPVYDLVKDNLFFYPYLPAFVSLPWLVYFYGGIIFVKYEELILQKINKYSNKSILFFSCLFSLTTYSYVILEFISRSKYNPVAGNFDHFHRLSILLYSISIWWLFFILLRKRSDHQTENIPIYFREISSLTFSIYLYHPSILRLLQKVDFPLKNILLSITVFSITLVIVYFIKRAQTISIKIKMIIGV